MHSSRVLGVVALTAILVAAISFAVVDVSIAAGCDEGPCNTGIPIVAITFAALGALAALVRMPCCSNHGRLQNGQRCHSSSVRW